MPDRGNQGARLRISRHDDIRIDQCITPVERDVTLLLVDAVVAFVAGFREDRTNLLLEKLDLTLIELCSDGSPDPKKSDRRYQANPTLSCSELHR